MLFSDLVDFTVLSQKLDAEDVRTVIDAYFLRWQHHIEANGGVVEKFIGDAVMAVFGLHKAEEEDPHRSIRARLGHAELARRPQRRHRRHLRPDWCEGNFQTYEEQRRERMGESADEPTRFRYKKLQHR